MADIALPNDIANGQDLDATKIEENYTEIESYINTNLVRVDGTVSMTGALTLPASDPTTDNHAARKAYVDSAAGMPIGVVQMFAGASAPSSSWLLCKGAAVSRTTYADLFTLIGTTYGAGDGSTTFNLPNFASRVPIGVGTGSGLTARALGATGGAESATLAETNLPATAIIVSGSGGIAATPGAGQSTADNKSSAATSFSIMEPFLAVNFIIKCL